MPISLIALDVDGTLMDSRNRLTAGTLAALDEAARAGIHLVLSTGRMLSECRELLARLPMIRYAVTCTGAQTFDLRTGETIGRKSLTADELRTLCGMLEDLDVMFQIFDDHDGLIHNDARQLEQAERYFPAGLAEAIRRYHAAEPELRAYVAAYEGPTNKLHMMFGSVREQKLAIARLRGLPYTIVTSCENDLEIMPPGVDKGLGLRQLSEHLGLTPDRVMAIGDGGNDAGMLRFAGLPVAMGNAPEDVKALARWITDDNDHDGAAKAIRRVLEKQEGTK